MTKQENRLFQALLDYDPHTHLIDAVDLIECETSKFSPDWHAGQEHIEYDGTRFVYYTRRI